MLSLTQKQSLSQRLTPQQVQYLKMLQLPVLALEQNIKQELEMNPLLEETQELDQEETLELLQESPVDRDDDSSDSESIDTQQAAEDRENDYDWEEFMPSDDDDGFMAHSYSTGADGDQQDNILQRSEETLAERLLAQLRLQTLSDDEIALAEEIIGNIDGGGYLRRDLTEIVEDLNNFIANISRATSTVQSVPSPLLSGTSHFDSYAEGASDEPFGRDRLSARAASNGNHSTVWHEEHEDDIDQLETEAEHEEEEEASGSGIGSLSLEEMSRLSIEELAKILEQGTSSSPSQEKPESAESQSYTTAQENISETDDTEILNEEQTESAPQETEPAFTIDEAEAILHRIQRLDPPGIGARNLQECLLIQLEIIPNKTPEQKLAMCVIRDTYDEFTMKHFPKICQKLGCTTEELKEAIEVIKTLNPKPGDGSTAMLNSEYVTPDFIIEHDGQDFIIIPNDRYIPSLQINKGYRELLRRPKKGQAVIDRNTRKFLRQKLESAKWFMASIQQRRHTMTSVMQAIVDLQHEFFQHGPEHIKPMIYKDVAERIGMDISTVCRVVNGKYVQTDYGVFELRYFFSEKLETVSGEEVSTKIVKARIKELIGGESKKKPLSDEALSAAMKDAGFNVARRTVAKYREQMNIPVARLRKAL